MYPVLGSPHYHQPHDTLDTINHQLVTEVAKTTAATLMLLAASPSRLANLKVDRYENGTAALSWTPSPETGVTGYLVAWGPADKPESQQIRVTRPAASIKVEPGTFRRREGREPTGPGRVGLGEDNGAVGGFAAKGKGKREKGERIRCGSSGLSRKER